MAEEAPVSLGIGATNSGIILSLFASHQELTFCIRKKGTV